MDQPGGGWDCDWNGGLREEGEALRPRFTGGTKTPKSRLKLLAKAAFHNSVSLSWSGKRSERGKRCGLASAGENNI